MLLVTGMLNQAVVDAIDKQVAARREACLRAADHLPEFITTFAPSDLVLTDDVVDRGALEALSRAASAFSDQLIGFAGVVPDAAVAEAYLEYSGRYADYAVALHHRAVLCGLT